MALMRDGVWVGPKEYRQVFEVYNDPPGPIFVTTDGPIVAGYRLMERTVMRMERWSFALLPRGLREMEAKLGEAEASLKLPARTAAAASRRARLVVAVARLLLGEEPEGLDHATLAQARECAALVEKAEGRSVPPGLGPPDPGWLGFDWRVFRPRGPYAGEDSRERAFRATRWLQTVPFRLARDDEVAALWLIAESKDWYWPSPMWAAGLLPLTEERSVHADAFHIDEDDDGLDANALAALRAALDRGLAGSVSTDLLHESPHPDGIRLAPRLRLPDDEFLFLLLHPVWAPPVPGAGFPAGCAVAAALGSPLAQEAIGGIDPGRHLSHPEALSWITHAYRMRGALLDAAEPDAPALFSSPAWHRKSLRTALGSWALERNVWTLHSGPVMSFFGGPKQHPGVVEPDPEVFACLAEMGRFVLAWMKHEDVDTAAMRLEYADPIRAQTREAIASLLDPKISARSGRRFLWNLREIGVLTKEEYEVASPPGGQDDGIATWRGEEASDAEIGALRARLESVLTACERWHARTVDPAAEGPDPGEPLAPRWKRWVDLCTRLELLAHKQLRRQSWNDADVAFLVNYGTELAEILGYSCGSLTQAVDDAPRAAAVICDPLNKVMRVVGAGRPRELWVLYPDRGGPVPCRGVVLSYYEFDAKEAPTDAEWKAMLDSKDPPREPAYLNGE